MKKFSLLLLAALLAVSLIGCAPDAPQQYRTEFLGTFDTVVSVIGYADTEEEFSQAAGIVHETFAGLHQLFDIYHGYSGVNNIKTINDNAGLMPVKVDARIIELLQTAKEWHSKTDGAVNVAMGPVLAVWHEYRGTGIASPEDAAVPGAQELAEAAKLTDIGKIAIDEAASTVYIEAGMRIDVGAIAKGYATQAAADALIAAGYDSVLISAGGNVAAVGAPKDGRDKWGVGVKDPQSDLAYSTDDENLLDVAYVSGVSVVSSGSYERYYEVDGVRYHHLIDPQTLFPAAHCIGVTVIAQDSTAADVLSTAAFVLPPEEAMLLIENTEGTEALWVHENGDVTLSSGMAAYLKHIGGATNGA